jgi:hypothetical protein
MAIAAEKAARYKIDILRVEAAEDIIQNYDV